MTRCTDCGAEGTSSHAEDCYADIPDWMDEPDEVENDGPAGDYLADYWFTAGGPDEPPGLDDDGRGW